MCLIPPPIAAPPDRFSCRGYRETRASAESIKSLLKTAFVLYAIALIMVALTPNLPLLLLPAALFGVAQGINLPNVFSLLNAHAPTENRGAFMATNGMSLRAGQTIGPLFMASAAGTLGLPGAYVAAAGMSLYAFLLVLALVG